MIRKAVREYRFCLFLIATVWLLQMLQLALGEQFKILAIRPREVGSLHAIITMHLLHWNLAHLVANSVPLMILGFLISASGRIREVTLLTMILSGSLVWFFARDALHAGSSALVMGFWAYLVSRAYFQRSARSIFLAAVTLLIYGGLIFTLFDFRSSVSFEGHAFGFLSGVVCAWALKARSNSGSLKRGIG